VSEFRNFGRRATDLLDLGGRAWLPMPVPSPAGVMGGGDILGRHLARVDQLERRVAELERDNRELAAFAADVAHDLRAPLQAISGFTELLARRQGPALDETSQGFLAHILTATGSMRELVEAVLDHRQSSYGALAPGWVRGNDLVATVLRRLQSNLDEAHAEIDVGALPTVFADRVQLGRVFQNLIFNAVRAARPDEPPRVSITGRRLPSGWEFAVTDNGVGVRPEDRNRIFELFQRGSGDAPRCAGHGMGLTICRTIVERHGGRIGVERAADSGARFSFTIPDRHIGMRSPGGADSRS
jgi:light-regulated signal transduction histidine kinase (bacteriophytochrome)